MPPNFELWVVVYLAVMCLIALAVVKQAQHVLCLKTLATRDCWLEVFERHRKEAWRYKTPPTIAAVLFCFLACYLAYRRWSHGELAVAMSMSLALFVTIGTWDRYGCWKLAREHRGTEQRTPALCLLLWGLAGDLALCGWAALVFYFCSFFAERPKGFLEPLF